MKRDELDKLSREGLLELARKLDITGRTRMVKGELVRAILAKLPFAQKKASLESQAKTRAAVKTEKKSIRFVHTSTTPLPPRQATSFIHQEVGGKARSAAAAIKPSARPAAASTKPAPVPARHHEKQWHRDPYTPANLSAARQNGILPNKYDLTFVRLLVRDPRWLYACWEITADTLHQAEKKTGEKADQCPRLMRVYCFSDERFNGHNHDSFFDIEIGWLADNWYVEVPHPDHGYCVEIGLKLRDGRFFPLVRSNAVRTPRDSVSDVLDEEWATSDAVFSQIFALSGGLRIGAGSLDFSKELRERLRQELSSGWFSSFREAKLQPHRPPEKAKAK